MIERANQFTGTRDDGARPNPSRWSLFKREIGQRHDGRLPLQVGARLRPADGPRRRRRALRRRSSSTRSSIRRRRAGRRSSPAPPGRRSAARRRATEHREPHGLPRSDRAGRVHRRRPAGRLVVLRAARSASRSCSRSATASSRRRRRAGVRCIRRLCPARPSRCRRGRLRPSTTDRSEDRSLP